jgi:hypothetical protein
MALTQEGSPCRHTLPSPTLSPPPPPPPSPSSSPVGPSHRHLFETRVIPRITAMDQAEEALANALVVIVDGDRPTVSLPQVVQLLVIHYAVSIEDV